MMKKNPKRLFLDIGIILSVALCFMSAFLVLYHSGRQPVQAREEHPASSRDVQIHPVESKSLNPDSDPKDIAHQKMLSDALRRKPDHVPVLMELSRMEGESGNLRGASEYLKKVLSYEPQNIEAKLNLGKQMFEMGNTEEAIRLNMEILENQPLNPDALYNLGAIYGNLGDRDQAMLYWNRLIASSPESESGTLAKQMLARM
jgi:tetratricopeptide (TPR) repeat protein